MASTIIAGVSVSMATPALSQDASRSLRPRAETVEQSNVTQLETITVTGSGEDPRGPDKGIVAKRSLSASKTDTSLLETPQAVSVVTRQQMDMQGANTVPEALRYTPGVLSDPNVLISTEK